MTYIYHGNVSVPHNKLQVGSRDKTMADKQLYIPNDDAQNYLFCRLQLTSGCNVMNNQLNAPTIENFIEVPKVVKTTMS